MNDSYRLELNFIGEFGNNRKITIRRPVEGLTEEEIKPVMQTLTEHEIFNDDSGDPYQTIKNARYVRTSVEDVFAVE